MTGVSTTRQQRSVSHSSVSVERLMAGVIVAQQMKPFRPRPDYQLDTVGTVPGAYERVLDP
jgi:hypothetical protein